MVDVVEDVLSGDFLGNRVPHPAVPALEAALDRRGALVLALNSHPFLRCM